MNKITLISFYPGFFGLNIRQIGACLREAGFEVTYLHLGYTNYQQEGGHFFAKNLPQAKDLVDILLPEIVGSVYVGISLSSSEFKAAREFTVALKRKTDVPVIWGGPHPTAAFEQCVGYADYVCVGEGERTSVELAYGLTHKETIKELPNLAYLENDHLHLNQLHPIIPNLDSLPLPDTDIYRHMVLVNGQLRFLDPELLVELDRAYIRPVPNKVIYVTTLTRGCPNSCSYCNNSYLNRIYKGQKYYRRRSLDRLFLEIKQACKDIGVIGAVFLADDNLTASSIDILRDFAVRWKNEISLPFGTSGSPSTISDEKIKTLAQTGLLYKFGVGIESVSKQMLELYNRHERPSQAVKAVEVVEKNRHMFYQEHVKPVINYQFIFDNPYEKVADITANLRFLLKLPERYSATCFHLVMYPGSQIYHQAQADRLLTNTENIDKEDYGALDPTFTRVWLKLYRIGLPRFLLKLLTSNTVFSIFDSFIFRFLYSIVWADKSNAPETRKPNIRSEVQAGLFHKRSIRKSLKPNS
jgi:anaerobic magnesium-protoporphyrin IX monomethyl ester cyclase